MPMLGVGDSCVGAPPLVAVPDLEWPQPPPALEDPSDLQAAYEWLRVEKHRLEQYTRSQFASIQQQHQALLDKHFRSEQSLALRSQELNRQRRCNDARELADREAALSGQMDQLARAQEELLTLEQTSQNIRQDTKIQHSLLEQLRAQTAQLQQSHLASRSEFDNFEIALKERQQAWAEKQAELSAHQAERKSATRPCRRPRTRRSAGSPNWTS